MNQSLVSIVVPIYNVEKYLPQCIDSIINQTYQNIEIILVDDGSPDNCGKICDDYANKDERIKVIHKENGGLSDARNYGIDVAIGKYIVFVDSDDYIDNKYIEILYNAIKTNNTRVSQCNILKVNDKGEALTKVGYLDNQIKNGKCMIKDLYKGHTTENIVTCNKMYEIELFENLRYPFGKIHEDEYTTYKILYNTDKIAVINEYLYNYRQNQNSITGRKFNIKRLDKLEAYDERMKFFEQKGEKELYELTAKTYLGEIRECYVKTRKHIAHSKELQKELIRKYRENYKKAIKFENISHIAKIKGFVFHISPKLYYYLKR